MTLTKKRVKVVAAAVALWMSLYPYGKVMSASLAAGPTPTAVTGVCA